MKFSNFLSFFRFYFENLRWDNKEEKIKGGEREPKRYEAEKVETELKKESRHKEHGDKRKSDVSVRSLWLSVVSLHISTFFISELLEICN